MSTQTDVEEVISQLRTNRHGRAALGIASANLRRGYEVIDTITPSLVTAVVAPALALFGEVGDREVRAQARDLLDRTNAYATWAYFQLPDNDDPLAEDMRGPIGAACGQAASNLQLLQSVKADLVQTFVEELFELAEMIGTATVESVKYVADQAKRLVQWIWPTWLSWAIGGALCVGAGVLVWRLSTK